jgi:hypothetical protein
MKDRDNKSIYDIERKESFALSLDECYVLVKEWQIHGDDYTHIMGVYFFKNLAETAAENLKNLDTDFPTPNWENVKYKIITSKVNPTYNYETD